VKRYYIEVEMMDGPTQNIDADGVQQQNQTEKMAVSNYFSTPAEAETSLATTSLADMLK